MSSHVCFFQFLIDNQYSLNYDQQRAKAIINNKEVL